MPKVQPGRPNASLYSVSTVLFRHARLTVSILVKHGLAHFCHQTFSVQDAVVIYRDIDEFLQTLRCKGFVSGVALDPRSGKVRSAAIVQEAVKLIL